MKKRIDINNQSFLLQYDEYEETKIWRVFDSIDFISGYSIDIEIDLENFEEKLALRSIKDFLKYLLENKKEVEEHVKKCQEILIYFIRKVWQSHENNDFNDVSFIPTGINFKDVKKGILSSEYKFDIFFFPIDKSKQEEIGDVTWKASFTNNQLISIGREI